VELVLKGLVAFGSADCAGFRHRLCIGLQLLNVSVVVSTRVGNGLIYSFFQLVSWDRKWVVAVLGVWDISALFVLLPSPVKVRVDWLVFYGTSTQDRSIWANLPGGITGSGVEDRQRGTYKNIQLHAMQWTYTCNDKQQVCLTCLKISNAYNKLHDPEWVKKNASGVQHLLYQLLK